MARDPRAVVDPSLGIRQLPGPPSPTWQFSLNTVPGTMVPGHQPSTNKIWLLTGSALRPQGHGELCLSLGEVLAPDPVQLCPSWPQ